MTDRNYCTYFDIAYAPRGRVLIESLRASGDFAVAYVLALDEEAFLEVSSWDQLNVQPLRLADLEAAFPQLAQAKADRSRMEYVFTLTPWLTQWVMSRIPQDTWVTYLDADMAFYSSTDAIYTELESASVGIVEHRFTREQAWRRKYGRFNVAWVGFRNDPRGLTCLKWWADCCLEWCRDEVSIGRFADQGYLDSFPDLFAGVGIISAPGADVAPWNLRRHKISLGPGGEPLVDGSPLIFFHFHGLKRDGGRYYFKHVPYFAKTTPAVRDAIYLPYCLALEAATPSDQRSLTVMDRRATLLSSLRSGRAATLRWLAIRRGDYVDVGSV